MREKLPSQKFRIVHVDLQVKQIGAVMKWTRTVECRQCIENQSNYVGWAQLTVKIDLVSDLFNKNSSGDEIANVNFFYDDIAHVGPTSKYLKRKPTLFNKLDDS